MIDASTILDVTRSLIGHTEPYGDSSIDRERTQNLDKLIYIVDELLYDVEKVAYNKNRYEGSMLMMGEKADEALKIIVVGLKAILKTKKKRGDNMRTTTTAEKRAYNSHLKSVRNSKHAYCVRNGLSNYTRNYVDQFIKKRGN